MTTAYHTVAQRGAEAFGYNDPEKAVRINLPNSLTLPVQAEHGGQINLREYIAIEDDHRLGEVVASVSDGARCPKWRWLDDVTNGDADG